MRQYSETQQVLKQLSMGTTCSTAHIQTILKLYARYLHSLAGVILNASETGLVKALKSNI